MIFQSYWQVYHWQSEHECCTWHDGAPAHFSRAVRDVLNNTYHDGRIGRGGPNAWPSLSPDLNPLDFYLWEYLSPLFMQLLLATKRHFTIALWMPVRVSATTPPPPFWTDVLVHDEACRGAHWISREAILSTYSKCTLSAVTHTLNVSGHMLITIFFLVLVCGTRAQSLYAIFSYTLYTELCNFVKRSRLSLPKVGLVLFYFFYLKTSSRIYALR
jgi:hypothetical protein